MYIIPECCICRLSLKNNLCVEKNCGNIFHYSCMKQWIGIQKSCPLCKCTCCKKNLLFIHYEINEENKIMMMDENYINKSKNELYEDLVKYEAELIKMQNENEKYSLEILTLTNKNKILSDTICKNNIKINQEQCEKLKLKELKDEYFKDKILLTTKIEEYDKELKKYKIVEKYLEDLNKEDLNQINLLFGFNILTIEQQQNVILNYIKNSLSNKKKSELTVKQLEENIIQKDSQIQKLKEKLYAYRLNHDMADEDSNDRPLANEQPGDGGSKTIKIKSKVIRRIKTLNSGRKTDVSRSGGVTYSKSKTSGTTELSENQLTRNPLRSSPIRSSPIRSSPIRSSPVRSSPVRSSPVRSSPMRSSPMRSNPLRSNSINSNSHNSQDFINFIDKKINNSNSPEHINVTPQRRKFHSIEVDIFRNKSVDKFFNDLTEKNNTQEGKDFTEVYSIPTDSGNTKSSSSSYKPQTAVSSALKHVCSVKTNKSRNGKSYAKQSTKITDFFKRV
ncbi:hypothetical protein, conserved [Plasmodium gonderi]|uniref:RING-type domain-containing protein n=1 Tax=Plasmodium gonderi TaxID=77519 RepID=A0A1Y1JKQ8_PLAGO|nr:hypothetical protein, conserved [Plasmodium gonderi]GAW82228.1 hypothetical protein, conserved [Plasmodium gonderi]